MTREEIQQQLDEDRQAVLRAQAESQRIARALKRSRRIRRDSLPKLRKAREAS